MALFLGYNFPFIVWTLISTWYAIFSVHVAYTCPIQIIFSNCPGCGLTRSYAQLLQGKTPDNWWFWAVLFGFAINFVYSLKKITVKK
ncbi:MAG: DUF2752 domain-containing protein [Candidatus Omnitrophota bacterium]